MSGRVPTVAAYPECSYLHVETEKTYGDGSYLGQIQAFWYYDDMVTLVILQSKLQ